MNAAVSTQPVLNSEEQKLVVELLERELRELPAEIHHTRTASFRDELRRRMGVVEQLLARLRPGSPA
ncbi:MAG: hypothetical protein ABFD60_08685 [Bryobacteraceae bacterium]